MTKDEMKNRISMALKDPILQQGFEIICKDLAISEHDREHNAYELTEVYKKVEQLEKENAELKKGKGLMKELLIALKIYGAKYNVSLIADAEKFLSEVEK